MKKNVLLFVFAALTAFSFTSCKKCFQCTASHAEVGSFYTEPEVTCGEKVDDHKSVLEQTYSCATCTSTSTIGGVPITNESTNCGAVEDIDIWVADQLDNEDENTTVTCNKSTPTVNCYEAE